MYKSITDKVRLFASPSNWIEGNAVSQLRGTSELEGMELAVGLPDLHPGKCGPVGAAFVSTGVFYPHLVGNDVGCGMGLWQSELSAKKTKLDRWERKLTGLDSPWDGDRAEWLQQFGAAVTEQDGALGTIGGGNHFAELQQIDSVADQPAFDALGLDAERLMVLVHSGSRGLGRTVLMSHQLRHGYASIDAQSDDAQAYLALHDHAVKWATASRALIAQRFLHALGSVAKRVLDVPHNFVARDVLDGRECWIHRKGANASDQGVLVVPGSRGTLSYLVVPTGDQSTNAKSVSHGAGRKWARTDCKARLFGRYDETTLLRTSIGSRVICEDRELLYEEAPQAYKNVDVVVQDLVDARLVKVVATLRPLITYKLRRAE
ncbi:MAG: RNA ligase RtcB family protein [Planctomycetota bacterium]